MNGDREWALRCVAWLDEFLARKPTAEDSFRLVFSGWHDCDLLVYEEDFTRLLQGIRDKLLREIPNWRYEIYVEHLFDCDEGKEVSAPTLEYFVKPFNPFPNDDIPDLFSSSWLTRYALECREKPELLDRIISELKSVLFNLRSDEEIDEIWSKTGVCYTFSKGGIRILLTMALGAFETAKMSINVPMRHARKFLRK